MHARNDRGRGVHKQPQTTPLLVHFFFCASWFVLYVTYCVECETSMYAVTHPFPSSPRILTKSRMTCRLFRRLISSGSSSHLSCWALLPMTPIEPSIDSAWLVCNSRKSRQTDSSKERRLFLYLLAAAYTVPCTPGWLLIYLLLLSSCRLCGQQKKRHAGPSHGP